MSKGKAILEKLDSLLELAVDDKIKAASKVHTMVPNKSGTYVKASRLPLKGLLIGATAATAASLIMAYARKNGKDKTKERMRNSMYKISQDKKLTNQEKVKAINTGNAIINKLNKLK